jgi:hypothetical protein
MPRWLPEILAKIHTLARERRVRFTLKALRELASLALGLDAEDAIEVLAQLTAADWAGRLLSERTGERLYVFKPRIAGIAVYLKLAVRSDCIVISFHRRRRGRP